MATIRALRCASTALQSASIGSIPHLLKMKYLFEKLGRERPRHAQKGSDSPITKELRGIEDALLIDARDGRHRGNPKVHGFKNLAEDRRPGSFRA
jgi:hypothetical protein